MHGRRGGGRGDSGRSVKGVHTLIAAVTLALVALGLMRFESCRLSDVVTVIAEHSIDCIIAEHGDTGYHCGGRGDTAGNLGGLRWRATRGRRGWRRRRTPTGVR